MLDLWLIHTLASIWWCYSIFLILAMLGVYWCHIMFSNWISMMVNCTECFSYVIGYLTLFLNLCSSLTSTGVFSPLQLIKLLIWLKKKKIVTILEGANWYLIVVLSCISLMTNEIELLFMGVLASSYLEKCLLRSCVYF